MAELDNFQQNKRRAMAVSYTFFFFNGITSNNQKGHNYMYWLSDKLFVIVCDSHKNQKTYNIFI